MHEYGLKFTQLSRYASKIVKDMRNRMSLFIFVLGLSSRKEIRVVMLIGDMNILRLMIYVQYGRERKVEGPRRVNKKSMNMNESGMYKSGSNQPQFRIEGACTII